MLWNQGCGIGARRNLFPGKKESFLPFFSHFAFGDAYSIAGGSK